MTAPNKIKTVLRKWLDIREPKIPEADDYGSIVNYMMGTHEAAVRYYRLVLATGVVGMVISIICGLVLLHTDEGWNWDLLFQIKEYPAAICSAITMSFSQIEIEQSKRELYKKLETIAREHGNEQDWPNIINEYKKWSWSEFQNRFKP